MNSSNELHYFKTSSLSLFIIMAANAIGAFVLTGVIVNSHTFKESGSVRAIIIGLAIFIILASYAFLCFKAFKTPTAKRISIIYNIQAVLFAIFSLLLWLAIFY